MDPILTVYELTKRYREGTRAASSMDCSAPNGAEKITLIRILATLLRPDSGTGRVAGFDDPAGILSAGVVSALDGRTSRDAGDVAVRVGVLSRRGLAGVRRPG